MKWERKHGFDSFLEFLICTLFSSNPGKQGGGKHWYLYVMLYRVCPPCSSNLYCNFHIEHCLQFLTFSCFFSTCTVHFSTSLKSHVRRHAGVQAFQVPLQMSSFSWTVLLFCLFQRLHFSVPHVSTCYTILSVTDGRISIQIQLDFHYPAKPASSCIACFMLDQIFTICQCSLSTVWLMSSWQSMHRWSQPINDPDFIVLWSVTPASAWRDSMSTEAWPGLTQPAKNACQVVSNRPSQQLRIMLVFCELSHNWQFIRQLKEMDVIWCNCDFVYGPTVLQLQLKSNLAKSGSGQILGVRYPNPYLAENQYPSILTVSTYFSLKASSKCRVVYLSCSTNLWPFLWPSSFVQLYLSVTIVLIHKVF